MTPVERSVQFVWVAMDGKGNLETGRLETGVEENRSCRSVREMQVLANGTAIFLGCLAICVCYLSA